jgi:hypothetical protein
MPAKTRYDHKVAALEALGYWVYGPDDHGTLGCYRLGNDTLDFYPTNPKPTERAAWQSITLKRATQLVREGEIMILKNQLYGAFIRGDLKFIELLMQERKPNAS